MVGFLKSLRDVGQAAAAARRTQQLEGPGFVLMVDFETFTSVWGYGPAPAAAAAAGTPS